MWPVYSRALRETFVLAISKEAALIAAAFSRIDEARASVQGRYPNPPRCRAQSADNPAFDSGSVAHIPASTFPRSR